MNPSSTCSARVLNNSHPRSRRRVFIRFSFWLILLSGCGGSSDTPVPMVMPPPFACTVSEPNVVFLFADDMRPDAISAFGNDVVSTPNIDSLISRGTTLTKGIVSQPICPTSRAEIITGINGFTNGVHLPQSIMFSPAIGFLPDAFRSAGYNTWHVGKWHVEGRPWTRGYDDVAAFFFANAASVAYTTANGLTNPTDMAGRDVTGYLGWMFMEADEVTLYPNLGVGLTERTSEYITDGAIEALQSRVQEPFFMQVNYTAPHDPLFARAEVLAAYPEDQMPVPLNFMPQHEFNFGIENSRDELLFAYPRTELEVREETARYYAVITDLDTQMGRILTTLEDTGLMDNTLVIFASDQGIGLGSHGIRGKLNMYEHTVTTPIVFAGPCVTQQQITAQTYLRDVLPTAIDYAGIPVPNNIDSISVMSLINAETSTLYDYTFGHWSLDQRMVRTDEWKLNWYVTANEVQLFNFLDDPDELNNLIGDPGARATRDELTQRLTQWQDEVNDPLTERLTFVD